jgi:hypothetical protein
MPGNALGDLPVSIILTRRETGLDFELHCGAAIAMRGQLRP